MPERLIYVPPDPRLLQGDQVIDHTYPRRDSYSPEDMRAWAADLATVNRLNAEDRGRPPGQSRMERLCAADPSALSAKEARLVRAHQKFHGDHDVGIRGDLRPDGVVELGKGRHRAHYVMERGDPVPVHVSCRDPEQLDRFETVCRVGLDRTRNIGRVGLGGAQDDVRSPEYRTAAGEGKVVRERGIPLDERNRPFRGEGDRSRERY